MFDCFATYNNDSYIMLINSDSSLSDESLSLTIKRFMDTTFPNVEAHAGLGSNYDSPLCINSSYAEALSVISGVSASYNHQVSIYDRISAAYSNSQNDIEISLDEDENLDRSKTCVHECGVEKNQVKAKREPVVANQAKEYIDKNFTDPLLGLYSISEKLHVNNSYLSTVFKATFGVNILQYINKKRIEKAKELILNTDKSIKEIAQLSGFSSDINFIRVFKKYENKTPSAYRDIDE